MRKDYCNGSWSNRTGARCPKLKKGANTCRIRLRQALTTGLALAAGLFFSATAFAQFAPPSYKLPDLPQAHTGAGVVRCIGQPVVEPKPSCPTIEEPDPGKVYVADEGARLYVFRPYGRKKDETAPLIHVEARAGSYVELRGAAITAVFEAGSDGVVMDGVRADAYGKLTVYGDAVVRAFDGARVIDKGRDSNVYAYKGATVVSQARGRVYAYDGSTVYAKSPPECDDCTQVRTFPGSVTYLYDATEAFSEGGTVHVFEGGDVHGSNGTIAILYKGAHFSLNPDCKEIHSDGEEVPFPGE